jgi:Amt family ammonium transporter
MKLYKNLLSLCAILFMVFATPLAFADEPPKLDSGDTAWMLTSTALVLMMTIPGLALFYAGMVRSKNVLSVLMQCFAITSLVSVLWMLFGYSIAFGDGGSAYAMPSAAPSPKRYS